MGNRPSRRARRPAGGTTTSSPRSTTSTGAWTSAQQHYREALELSELSGATFLHGVAAVGLVSVQAAAGETEAALRGYGELIDYWERTGGWTQQWTTLRNLADLLDRLDDHDTGITPARRRRRGARSGSRRVSRYATGRGFRHPHPPAGGGAHRGAGGPRPPPRSSGVGAGYRSAKASSSRSASSCSWIVADPVAGLPDSTRATGAKRVAPVLDGMGLVEHEAPRPHVLGLLLEPHELVGVRVAGQHLEQLLLRERVQLLDADDRRRRLPRRRGAAMASQATLPEQNTIRRTGGGIGDARVVEHLLERAVRRARRSASGSPSPAAATWA